MIIQKQGAAAAITLLAFANPIGAQELDALSEIRICAAIGDTDSRFACYEALGNRVSADETVPAEPAVQEQTVEAPQALAESVVPAAAATATVAAVTKDTVPEPTPEPQVATQPAPAAPETLPEDIGGQEFEEAVEEAKPDQARGTVTSCQKGPDKKWYFGFASGQVWKQVDSTRLRFDDCNFDATISKDLFGYKMSIEGRADKIRVSRRK